MNIKLKITTAENMKILGVEKNTIIEVPFEEYVGTVVASEMGNAPEEALKA
jgi:peptidoglycan hydrolase-like amidase